ncbi:MAG TPA: DNA polymerase III subunit delta [Candidatus Faecisoma merdavium]|nr:DNA polymerase III subunit delta [Candidatus Faecisoma merdavium]
MIYILYGTINYLINKEISKIIEDNNIDEININKYDLTNTYLTDIINDASSMSLFDDKKIIIVNNSYIFTGTSKKVLEQDTTILENYLNNINDNTILIFIVNNDKIDERKKITKLIKKIGIVKEFNSIDNISLVKELFSDYNISTDNIKYLLERVGDDTTLLATEIGKIKIYKDKDKNITKDDITNLISKSLEVNNFKLIDAIINKNKNEAIMLYQDRIKLNEEPIAIIIALANQIRIMYQVKELYLNGYTENNIASILKIHPYRVKLANQNSKKYDSDILLNYLKQLANLDISIKTGKIDKQLGLELFILAL